MKAIIFGEICKNGFLFDFFLQIWHFCRQNLQTGALRKRCGFYAVQCPRGSQLLPAWPVLHSMAPFLNCISWPVNKLPVFVFVIACESEIGWQPRSWDDLYNCAIREAEAGWCAMCKIALQRPHIAINGCSSAICNLQNFSKLKKYRYNWSKSRQHQYFQILLLVFLIQDQDLPSLYFAHFIHSSWPVWSVTSFVWTF